MIDLPVAGPPNRGPLSSVEWRADRCPHHPHRFGPGPTRAGFTVMRKALFLAVLVLIPPGAADDSWQARSQAALLKSNWVDVAAEALEGKAADAGTVVPDWLLGYAGLMTGDGRMAREGFSRLDRPQMAAPLDAWASVMAQQAPNQAVGHLLRGDALARLGNMDAAGRALDETVRLTPRDPLARNVRGGGRFLAGRHYDAADDFETATELDPKPGTLRGMHVQSGAV